MVVIYSCIYFTQRIEKLNVSFLILKRIVMLFFCQLKLFYFLNFVKLIFHNRRYQENHLYNLRKR